MRDPHEIAVAVLDKWVVENDSDGIHVYSLTDEDIVSWMVDAIEEDRLASREGESVLVSWYDHDCDWVSKYCSEHHYRSATIPLSILREFADD